MKTTAAVLWERGQPLSVEEVELAPPGPGEVLVEMKAAGVCHSDLHPARDDWPIRTPVVLGHEGAGIVREVGAGVSRSAPAITSSSAGRRRAARARTAVRAARSSAIGSIAPRIATSCRRAARSSARAGRTSRISWAPRASRSTWSFRRRERSGSAPDVPFDALATVGCAVVTGVGAVTTAARAAAGSSVAIIGAGGVGLNVVQGAAIAGCRPIIAIDRHPAPLDIARTFGATDTIESPAKLADAVRDLTGGRGADFVFDTVGTPADGGRRGCGRAQEAARSC